jgi:hypothetical protein
MVETRNSRAAVCIGMSDVPWLDEKIINEILSSTPPHLRDAVKNGTPSLGSGAIYPIPLDDVVLSQESASKLRPYPSHWKYLYGMDVGWNKTAIVVVALDPDTDVMYVIDEYYQGKMEPEIHAARIKTKCDWMIGVIDPASKGRTQTDGKQLIQIYRSLGLKLREANNEVEAGIYKVWSRLATGKLKFMPSTVNLQNEYLLYRRDENGKIVKDHDHALDALRYAINTWQFAQQKPVKQAIKPSNYRKYNV